MAIPVFPATQVKPLRLKLGLNQEQLAQKLGITQGLVSMFERGERVPRGPVAILLGQMLGTANLDDVEVISNRS